jgi:hypothetical protein
MITHSNGTQSAHKEKGWGAVYRYSSHVYEVGVAMQLKCSNNKMLSAYPEQQREGGAPASAGSGFGTAPAAGQTS